MKKSVAVLLTVFMVFTTNNSLALAAQNQTPQPAAVSLPNNTSALSSDMVDSSWVQFENGSASFWAKEMANSIYSGSVSSKYSHEGIPAYRFELRRTDSYVNGSLRSEITTAKPEAAADENTYNFSILLPKGGDEDYIHGPKDDEIIAQWHNTPDPGEDWTYPPLSLHTSGDGHYHLYVVWDDKPMSTDQELDADGKVTSYDLGEWLSDKGNWVDWKFHVKWGWQASQHPIIQVYKDGNKVFELKDKPNTTNDKVGVTMKLGIYKDQWTVKDNPSTVTDRVIYVTI